MPEIDFTRLRQGEFREICLALEEALQQLDIDYYLIGAFARDVWFTQENINSRRTSDIDFAILVPEAAQFEKLKQYLSMKKGFKDLKNNAFAMRSPGGTTVDILPFGSIEIDEDPGEKQAVVTNGFKEVYERSVEIFAAGQGGFNIKVASLAGIFLLKLIAFEDRPEIRAKDPGDLMAIIMHYFTLHSEFIYEQHSDLFETQEDMLSLSSVVIGREIKRIVAENKPLHKRVKDFLAGQLRDAESSSFIRLMRQAGNSSSMEDVTNYIRLLLEGLGDLDA